MKSPVLLWSSRNVLLNYDNIFLWLALLPHSWMMSPTWFMHVLLLTLHKLKMNHCLLNNMSWFSERKCINNSSAPAPDCNALTDPYGLNQQRCKNWHWRRTRQTLPLASEPAAASDTSRVTPGCTNHACRPASASLEKMYTLSNKCEKTAS